MNAMPTTTERPDGTELLDRLALLFREHGYEGASLSRIAEATGLKRASLYHRFPGGKEEMALAVLRYVHARFATKILRPLAGDAEPRAKVRAVARELDAFYGGGAAGCLVDSLSLGERSEERRAAVASAVADISAAFTAVAKEAGHRAPRAKRLAEEALGRVQGALVLARVTGDNGPFQRALADLPDLLAGDA